MENLKAGRKKNRIESRMTKSLSHYEKAAIYKICRVEQENYLTLQYPGRQKFPKRRIP
jgi:hypothetical protein